MLDRMNSGGWPWPSAAVRRHRNSASPHHSICKQHGRPGLVSGRAGCPPACGRHPSAGRPQGRADGGAGCHSRLAGGPTALAGRCSAAAAAACMLCRCRLPLTAHPALASGRRVQPSRRGADQRRDDQPGLPLLQPRGTAAHHRHRPCVWLRRQAVQPARRAQHLPARLRPGPGAQVPGACSAPSCRCWAAGGVLPAMCRPSPAHPRRTMLSHLCQPVSQHHC